MSFVESLLRWLHIIAGIAWIGHLYFFNFVNGPFAATMTADVKKAVVPELMPRALWWFRWGAVWTWVTGVLLTMIIFYHGRLVFADPLEATWGLGALVSIALTFGGFLIYDALMSSAMIADQKIKNGIAFALVVLSTYIMTNWGGFGYRGFVIHIGAMFGTTMAYNVWFRIWPAQQKIITAIKNGTPPDAALVALAGMRSRHNTYMSVPLVWTMINSHTVTAIPGVPAQIGLFIVILLGWHIVWQLYKRAGKIKGF